MTGLIRKAVFISALDYESPIQIGDHHLARQFAENGWQVLFISKPITPFHIFSKNRGSINRRFNIHRKNGIKYKISDGEIQSFVPFAFLIPQNIKFLEGKWIYNHWYRTIMPGIKKSLAVKDFLDIDLIYIRDPLQGYLLDIVNAKYKIFRLADNDSDFSSFSQHYAQIEQDVAQKVDMVVYTAKELESYVNKLEPKASYYLPNGVDFKHFQNKRKTPVLYQDLTRPIVVYAGSIDFWFDFELMNELAVSLPDFSFVIIGPNEKFRNKFVQTENLILTGSIPYSELPAYLSNADIGIIPFNEKEYPNLVNSINPVKLLEYLASGLPVVSSRWNELENIQLPVLLCDKLEDFVTALNHVDILESKRNYFIQFAKNNDWSTRYSILAGLIFGN